MSASKQVKIQDPDGEVFVIEAPADADNNEIELWASSQAGKDAINTARRNRMASQFVNGKPPSIHDPMPQERMGLATAVGGQMKHRFNTAIDEGIQPLMGIEPDAEERAALDRGRAFMAQTKEQGYPNIGGMLVDTGIGAAASFAPIPGSRLLAGKKLKGAFDLASDALKQGGAFTAAAPEGTRLQEGAMAVGGSLMGDALLRAFKRGAHPAINPNEEVQGLLDEGIRPTLLSSFGDGTKTVESKAMSLPFVGDSLAYGNQNAADEFAQSLFKRIGVDVTPNDSARTMHAKAQKLFNQRYDDALEGLTVDLNSPQLDTLVTDLSIGNDLTNSYKKQLANTLKKIRQDYAGQNLDGQSIQEIKERLAKQRRKFELPGNTGAEKGYADALGELEDSIFDLAAQASDDAAASIDALRKVNADYAQYAWMRDASNLSGAVKNKGAAGPGQFLSAFRAKMNRTPSGQNNLAAGTGPTADVQRHLERGQQIIGDNYPDSGTAGRLGMGAVLMGTGGSFYNPWVAIPAAGVAGAAYTNPGRKYLHGELYPGQKAFAKSLDTDPAKRLARLLGAANMTNNEGLPKDSTPWEK